MVACSKTRSYLLALASYIRKFESSQIFLLLYTLLPRSWDMAVHVAAFDVLFGRSSSLASGMLSKTPVVACPHILPAILASVQAGLDNITRDEGSTGFFHIPYAVPNLQKTKSEFPIRHPATTPSLLPVQPTESQTETLVEELIDLHSTNPTFRKAFQSNVILDQYIKLCRTFVLQATELHRLHPKTMHVTEKLTHLALMAALDNGVSLIHKEEVSS